MAGGSRKPRKGVSRAPRTTRRKVRPQPSRRERERMYEVLFEEASDAVFLLDVEGRFREVNRRACESLGYGREELLRMGVGDVELDLDLEVARSRRAASSPGRSTTLQGRHRRKDGTVFPVEVRAAEVDLGGERLTLAFARDVTGRKLAEQALLTSEAYFRAVFQGSSAAMAVVEPDGTIALANDAFCALAGRPREALEGARWTDLVAPGDLERMKEYDRRRLQGAADVPSRHALQIVRADGVVRDCLLSVSFIGTERRVLASFVDVTDLEAAQRDLRVAHEELQRHLTNTPLGVITWDRDYRVRSFSGRAEQIFGWRADEVVGRRADEIAWVPEDEWPRVREVIRQMEAEPGASHVMVNRNLRKDGTVVRCEWHNSSLHGPDGKLSSVFSLVQDVTALDAAQQQLQVASRLAALGTLVAGVAHEINNPLSGVTSSVVLASESLKELRGRALTGDPPAASDLVGKLDEAVEILGDAQVGARRVVRIIRDLTAFGRPDPRRTRFRLADGVEEAMRWVPASVSTLARIQVEVEGDAEVLASAGQIGQVVVNLVTNGAQAIPRGRRGTVTVRVGGSRDGQAVLEVEDDGEGIPEDVQARIFDPFFTTREVGQGTGLGLPVCHGIVSAHGGTLTVSSTPGKGSTFRVELPVAPAQVSGG